MTTGVFFGPVTVELRDAMDAPATTQTALTISLTSNSTGDHIFRETPTGPDVSSVVVLAGASQAVFYYRDYRSGNWTISASTMGLSPAQLPVSVIAGAYNGLFVLLPGQTLDPGRPITNPAGVLGNPNPQTAGSAFPVTVFATDAYGNPAAFVNTNIDLTSDDPAAPNPPPFSLNAGQGQTAMRLYTTGNRRLFARDVSDASKTGASSFLQINANPSVSTLWNVTHESFDLTTVVPGQSGVRWMAMVWSIGSGTNPIETLEIRLRLEKTGGAPSPVNAYFKNLILSSASDAVTLDVSGVSTSAVTWILPGGAVFRVDPPPGVLPVTLAADLQPQAPKDKVRFIFDSASSFVGQDAVSGSPVGVSTNGDATGFPMVSDWLEIRGPSLAETFGGYPNPFRPGKGPMTLEFYLQAPSTVELKIYDVLGVAVAQLVKGENRGTGLQRVFWDGRNDRGLPVKNGIYFARLRVGGEEHWWKIAVMR